ncbi:hypothetical protein HD806DRAFT_521989 [Xylariaceae sp. AK1471]|nr:hypothetical protein HD806DRAFT_521989 [Xylariaceae sp. AK1471]
MEELEPPPYDGRYDASDNFPLVDPPVIEPVIQPVILVLAGRLIHPESTSSTVLYELDHDVSFLSRADHKVVFSRHERRVRTDQYGVEVRTISHQRPIFHLENPPALTSTSRYAYYLTSASRRALGNVGLKKTFVPRLGFKVMRMSRSGEDEGLFEITRKDGRYEWWDVEGKRIAIEDNVDDQLKMIITTTLPRPQADVAMWCLRLWHDAVVNQDPSVLGGVGKRLGIGKWDIRDYVNRKYSN